MAKEHGWCRAGILFCVLLAMPAWAQSTKVPEEEYKDLIRIDQDIQPLGEHPFGADIGLYNGSLSFHQTDVSLAGKGPLLSLSRAFEIGRISAPERADKAFGDWDIALPRIETMTAQGFFQSQQVSGWQVNAASGRDLRCANFNKPLALSTMLGVSGMLPWEPATWWHGYHLVIPGQGSQDLLSNAGPDDATYPAVTRNHWRISCTNETTTANGEPGDGFIAHAPDGTTYRFDELVYRYAPTLERPLGSDGITRIPSPSQPGFMFLLPRDQLASLLGTVTGSAPAHAAPDHDFLIRRKAWMLVTRIEDRFGNTLDYTYDATGQLTKIEASDGRKLTVARVPGSHRIQSITLQSSDAPSRQWVYAYDTQVSTQVSLASVTLPNNRQWQFDLDAFANDATLSVGGTFHSCLTLGVPLQTPWTGSITHPSGLTGSFTVKAIEHGRSDVPRNCLSKPHGNDDEAGSYASRPKAWYSFTITQKAFSGAGIPTETWNYSYSGANASWSDECASGCASSVWTQVLHPDGSSTRRTFSNRYDYTETQLLRIQRYSGNGTGLVRSQENTYAAPDSGPWPARVGGNPQQRINTDQTEQRSPLKRRVVTQGGDTYTWQAEAFNSYAQVTRTKRFNSLAGQVPREESTTYRNDTVLWVLGLPEVTTNVATGEEISENVYGAKDTLSQRFRFGQEVMDYTFTADGQLSSFTDGNGNTTTLGSYKRGIPRSIGYPDGTSQSLAVDDLGQITAITDQAGHTTTYSYDDAGRVAGITYPAGGVSWYPKTFTYAYVTGSERGLAGGHWRRTVSTGDARHVTYFDALLRPVLSDTYIHDDGGSHSNVRTDYDWKGRTVFQSWPDDGTPSLDALNTGTHTTYDALGRVVQVTQDSELGPLHVTTAYPAGAQKKVTDPNGNVTLTDYQVFDRPGYDAVTRVIAAYGTPQAITQTIARDIYGNPTSITQSGAYGGETQTVTKALYYNAEHRLCHSREPETGDTLYGYDDAGNLAWSAAGLSGIANGCASVAAGARTVRAYDAMNRVTSIAYPGDTADSVFTYDALGQLKTARATQTTQSDAVTWTYDRNNPRGLLTSESLTVGSHPAWSFSYTYDRYGNRDGITYPDGKHLEYRPDALGRPSRAGHYATGVHYFPSGAVSDFVLGNQTLYLADENARQLLHNFSYENGSQVISKDRTYDKNANIVAIDDVFDDQRDKTFAYDPLNRLDQATAVNWGTIDYGYDALNNLRLVDDGNGSHSYVYEDATNRLVAIMNGSVMLHDFAYGPRGNTERKDSVFGVFDQANRLTGVTGLFTYAYDAAGRRVKKTDTGSGQSTYYAYDSAGTLLYQWDETTGDNVDYIYLGKRLLTELHRPAGATIMHAPGISVDASPSNGSYTVNWSAVTDASDYDLEEQINGGDWNPAASDTELLSKAYGSKPGGSYRYRVRACNGDCSDWSSPALAGVRPAMPDVTVPDGIQGDSYTVSWTRPASTDSFDVQERKNSGSWTTIVTDTTDRSISRPGTSDGSYTYRVSASNAYGSRGWSDESDTVTVLHAPAGKPTITTPDTSDTGSYTVRWTAVSGATTYQLQERKNGGGWSKIYDDSGRSKARSGRTNGAEYGYHARACNAAGCGQYGAVKTTDIAIPPPKPTGVYANYVEFKSNMATLTLVWDAVSGASLYKFKDVTSGSAEKGTTQTSYLVEEGDPPLSADTYVVRSCNAYACSAWVTANWRQVVPAPDSVSLSAPSGSGSGDYTVSWGEAYRATSYLLQERVNSGSWHTAYQGSGRHKTYNNKADATYRYRVRASNSGGDGPWSNTETVLVAKPPGTPGGLSVWVTGPYYKPVVNVSWNAVSHTTNYKLEETLPGHSPTTGNMGSATSSSSLIYADGQVNYRVRACNAAGCSGWSSSQGVYLSSGGGGGGKWLTGEQPTPATTDAKASTDDSAAAPAPTDTPASSGATGDQP